MKTEKQKQNKRQLNNKGMTLVELLVAMSLLVIVTMCFTPLFMSYYKNVKKAGDTVKSNYVRVGFIERLIGNDGFNGGYEYPVSDIPMDLTIEGNGKKMAAVVNPSTDYELKKDELQSIVGTNIVSAPDTISGGFTTFIADSVESSMLCFPSHIADDFREKTIKVYATGFRFDTNLANNMFLSKDPDGKQKIDKKYYRAKPTSSGQVADLTLIGNNDQICFQNSPVYICYQRGSKLYSIKIEIDAPTVIMVGEAASNGQYYYYVTSGQENEDGTMDIIAKTMDNTDYWAGNKHVDLKDAMHDVEWIKPNEGDGHNEVDGVPYGYYAMCGDNGQIRRFWKNPYTGNYYWGGDNTIYYEYNNGEGYVHPRGVNNSTGVGVAMDNHAVKNKSEYGTTADFKFNFKVDPGADDKGKLGTSKNGWLIYKDGSRELRANRIFTVNSLNGMDFYTFGNQSLIGIFEHGLNTGGWTDEWPNNTLFNRYILDKDWYFTTPAPLEIGGDTARDNRAALRKLYGLDGGKAPDSKYFSSAELVKASETTNPYGTNLGNGITLTSVDSIQMGDGYTDPEKKGKPISSYMLYCGYIPAVMDIWTPNATMTNGYYSDGKSHAFTAAKGDNGRVYGASDLYSRWRGTFGVEFSEAGDILDFNFFDKVRAPGTTLGAISWQYHGIKPKSYTLTGVSGIPTYAKNKGIDEAINLMNGKRKGITSVDRIIAWSNGELGALPLNAYAHQKTLFKQNETHISIGYLSNPWAMGKMQNIPNPKSQTVDVIKNDNVHQWVFNPGTTFLDSDSNTLETVDIVGDAATGELTPKTIHVSLAVGYTLGGLVNVNGWNRDALTTPTIMDTGVIYLRAGDSEAAESGYQLNKESNIFHSFYYTNSYLYKGGTEALMDYVASAKYWRDIFHPLILSPNGEKLDTTNDDTKFSYVAGHILFNKQLTCVRWGTTWEESPEAMWGTNDGTLMDWYITNEAMNDPSKASAYAPNKNVSAEFQSYRQVEKAREIMSVNVRWEPAIGKAHPYYAYMPGFYEQSSALRDKTPSKTKIIEDMVNCLISRVKIYGKGINWDTYPEMIGEDKVKHEDWGDNWASSEKPPNRNNAYIDRCSLEYAYEMKKTGKANYYRELNKAKVKERMFISPLDTIEDIEFANDIWVACGTQGQKYPEFCGPKAVADKGNGSWLAVRTWYNNSSAQDAAPSSNNCYYFWKAVKISNTENCNIQQVTYTNGMWYAVGYIDEPTEEKINFLTGEKEKVGNNKFDPKEKAVVFYAQDPEVSCDGIKIDERGNIISNAEGGWKLARSTGQGKNDTYTKAWLSEGNLIDIGGINSMASRTD